MKVRTSIITFAILGFFASYALLANSKDEACGAAPQTVVVDPQKCVLLGTDAGELGYLLPGLIAGALLGLFISPVFLSKRDEEEHVLKGKRKQLAELERKKAIRDIDARIKELS